jgi:hypothetical protein
MIRPAPSTPDSPESPQLKRPTTPDSPELPELQGTVLKAPARRSEVPRTPLGEGEDIADYMDSRLASVREKVAIVEETVQALYDELNDAMFAVEKMKTPKEGGKTRRRNRRRGRTLKKKL